VGLKGQALTTRQRKEMALDAARRALQARTEAGVKLHEPAAVFDIVAGLGIELRFTPIPSLEGMYRGMPRAVILVSSLRPSGRQAFTGAHELGHHVYGHGLAVDEIKEGASQGSDANMDSREYLADRFAGFFLMPKSAVKRGFRERGWEPKRCNPHQVYAVANWLGVGYETLVYHMRGSLNMLTFQHSANLLKTTPGDIRAEILGRQTRGSLLVVDDKWTGRAIDVQVGDLILLCPGARYEADNLSVIEETGKTLLLTGTEPGVGRVLRPETGWAAFVRVSRRDYVGLGQYRHWKDPDYVEGDGRTAALPGR